MERVPSGEGMSMRRDPIYPIAPEPHRLLFPMRRDLGQVPCILWACFLTCKSQQLTYSGTRAPSRHCLCVLHEYRFTLTIFFEIGSILLILQKGNLGLTSERKAYKRGSDSIKI